MSNPPEQFSLGSLQDPVDGLLARLQKTEVIRRIWNRDHTVWRPEPAEIANRLGWLDSPVGMPEALAGVRTVVDEVRRAGYTHALLLGMGGSSLAPEVLRRVFGIGDGHLDLAVLDSTHPSAVLAEQRRLDVRRTLFVPATKSGGTVETMSFLKYYYNRVVEAVGQQQAGEHFVAITDPGSGLEETARGLHFRHVFLNAPDIGGRYSALSLFGLVPALLLGLDGDRLLQRARDLGLDCPTAAENPGARLGAAMGAAAACGRDKLTLILSPTLAPFGAWIEQLVAESTGKEGRGILPVDGEPVGPPQVYADDRLFVYVRLRGEDTHDRAVTALNQAGHPVFCAELADLYDLGGEFFGWELATAVAGHCLGINPFDQPDVETAKVLARNLVRSYQEQGHLPVEKPDLVAGDIAVYAGGRVGSVAAALDELFRHPAAGLGRPYLALQAFLRPDDRITELLQDLRRGWRDRFQWATTLGFGPRFLHSTGQLHKGDAGRGLFIQFTVDPQEDAAIPQTPGARESHLSFGVLLGAQALGDRRALLDRHRRILRLHLGRDPEAGLRQLQRLLD